MVVWCDVWCDAAQDTEYSKLRVVPNIEEQFQAFFALVQGKFKAIAAFALAQFDIRKEEMKLFLLALDEVRRCMHCGVSCAQGKRQNREDGSVLIDQFVAFKEKVQPHRYARV